MLEITVAEREFFDNEKQMFFTIPSCTVRLEHSLVSLSKWESKFKKPFLSKEQKTKAETLYYIECMTITQNVRPEIYRLLLHDHLKTINDYIDDPMTATTINNQNTPMSRSIITSEVIYDWMIALEIPFECQRWHLNRLLMQINVVNIRHQPKKKMGYKNYINKRNALNAERNARMMKSE